MTISQSLGMTGATMTTSPHEIDVELFTFIERYATNLTRWDLLLYFGKDPGTQGDVSTIARYVKRSAQTVQKELDDLVYLGVLQSAGNNGTAHYALANIPATRRTVVRLARDFSTRR
jgi:predicted transcriptional regulator